MNLTFKCDVPYLYILIRIRTDSLSPDNIDVGLQVKLLRYQKLIDLGELLIYSFRSEEEIYFSYN